MGAQLHKQAHDYECPPKQQASSGILAAVELLLKQLHEERDAHLSPTPDTSPSPTKSGQPTEDATRVIADLDRSIERLENIKMWLTEDRQLLAMVDGAIVQHVRQMERRTNRFNMQLTLGATIGGALLGWLLAAVSSPQDLLRLLGH